jgi:hypothetical protein
MFSVCLQQSCGGRIPVRPDGGHAPRLLIHAAKRLSDIAKAQMTTRTEIRLLENRRAIFQ